MSYSDQEEVIIEFYLRSLKNDFTGFDWNAAFEAFRWGLEAKLMEHGQGSFEDYRSNWESMFGDAADLIPAEFTVRTGYVYFTEEDAAEALLRAQYECMKDTFESTFEHLADYVAGIDSPPEALADKIRLFDNIIHAQHETGDIFEDLDTEDLKDAAQEMFDCEQEENAA